MATVSKETREIDYPTTDGKPMGETELHIDEMIDARQVLRDWFADEPNVYVGGMTVFDCRVLVSLVVSKRKI